MENNKNLKVIVVACFFIIIGSFSYIYQLIQENESIVVDRLIKTSKKSEVLIELVKLNNNFSKTAITNPLIQPELSIEQAKMLSLIEQIEKTPEQKISFVYFNTLINGFYDQLKMLLEKNKTLTNLTKDTAEEKIGIVEKIIEKPIEKIKTKKQIITSKNGATQNEILSFAEVQKTKAISEIEVLKAKNHDKLTKIGIQKFTIETFYQKKQNKLEPSKTANTVDAVKISFNIPKNFVVRASTRNYYVQIFDSKNTLLGDEIGKISFDNNQKISYSLNINANYNNQELNISEILKYKNFKSGSHIAKIYDKSDLVGQTTFSLD